MFDFGPYFKKYEALVATADAAFEQLRQKCPDCVTCSETCDDCCYALFDLSLIEAMYINHKFREELDDAQKKQLLELANEADRQTHKIKRQLQKAAKEGAPEAHLFEVLSKERVRCPLLSDDQRCVLYRYRPITCRLYGVPLAIGGNAHTCGRAQFVKGQSYPTVKVDVFHQKLYDLSAELTQEIQSRFAGLAQMLVPLSMALLNDYNEEYLGIRSEDTEEKETQD